jgi:hypothetical protein
MYRIPAREDLLSQGDIFRKKFAFPYTANLQEDHLIIREGRDIGHSRLADAWLAGNEILVGPSFGTDFGIVLSNSCDIESNDKDPLEFVTIGAILPITTLPNDGKQGDCRRNRMVRLFYLAANESVGFPESYVHFGLLTLVRQESLISIKDARNLSMDHPYREDLGHRFGELFSRVARP